MARNQEKAQSMLYRFREAQAAELGIRTGPKAGQRRPRLASSVKDIRECERWRGDVLREISRKVSKIQDFGLTDYEVRDLNDEINKLLREKRHWENQLVSLGGANYRRGVTSQLDDSGREIPGTRGYKYFGRAKDLPGVKELLERSVRREEEQDEEERGKMARYRRFAGQPPRYWGDEDEDDVVDEAGAGTSKLLEEEESREREKWKQGIDDVAEEMGFEVETEEAAKMLGIEAELPRRRATNVREVMARGSAAQSGDDVEMGDDEEEGDGDGDEKKRKSTRGRGAPAKKAKATEGGDGNDMLAQLLPALDPAQLSTPVVPDRAATEAFILRERKRMLREEYSIGGGGEGASA